MKLSRLGQMIATAWVFSGMLQAAEVQVPSGHGTLATAIADAADGDTLILGDGSYLGNGALMIDKSLVIRSINRAASSVISADSLTIDAANKTIVLQGLDFGVDVTVVAADDVKVLEGQFLGGKDLNVSDYKTTEGDGSLMVIGNHFVAGSLITEIHSFDAYIAGNTFDKGHLISRVPVWIVGNSINGTLNKSTILIQTSGAVQIIANRVYAFPQTYPYGISVAAGTALIAGNIVQINSSNSPFAIRHGVISTSGTYAKVFNNIIGQVGGSSFSIPGSYGLLAYGEVSGNMIINFIKNHKGIGGSGIQNNLCFNNFSNTCGSNAITTDPLLIDRIDYKLGAGSPAIDAGSTLCMTNCRLDERSVIRHGSPRWFDFA